LRTITLGESVIPLLKTFLELLFWNALQHGRRMSLNVGPSKRSSVLGIVKSRTGPNLANMVDGPISISIFWPKTPGQRARHEQGHCHDPRSKHQAKVQFFSDEQPHVTLPNTILKHYAGSKINEIMSKLNFGNPCCHSVQNSFPRLHFANVKFKTLKNYSFTIYFTRMWNSVSQSNVLRGLMTKC
jgi:hypothetical protein